LVENGIFLKKNFAPYAVSQIIAATVIIRDYLKKKSKYLKENKMRKAELHKRDYESLKASILSDIWFHIKDREDKTLELTERKGIPAIVTQTFDEQQSELIDELKAEGDIESIKVIALASCGGYDVEMEYDLERFEAPMLLDILDSVEKHLELEKKEN
jgi:hypothetical protein